MLDYLCHKVDDKKGFSGGVLLMYVPRLVPKISLFY